MAPETLRVLLAADDPDRCESPLSFDCQVEMRKVRNLAPILELLTGRKFEVDENVQDASFFTDLGTYDVFTRPEGGTLRLAVLAVRFSSFGRLFTVWSVEATEGIRTDSLSPELTSKVIDAIRQHGYVYVDAPSLNVAYSGANPHLKGTSWWIRFFDYL